MNMTYHHLSVLVHRRAEKYGEKVALKYRDYETAQWIPVSWNLFSKTVRKAANAMVAMGMEEEENIGIDRKSTRLNSSHANISYAVFCLKKKNNQLILTTNQLQRR